MGSGMYTQVKSVFFCKGVVVVVVVVVMSVHGGNMGGGSSERERVLS